MIFTGVLINAVLVIIGTMIGLIFKGERLKNIGQRIFEAFALFVLVMGVSGAMDLSEPLIILGSIIAGVAIGEIIDIDKQFTRLGSWLQNKFAKNDSGFSRGFIEASLLFIGQIRNGEDHFLYLMLLHILQCGFIFHQNRNAMDGTSSFFRANINKAPGNIACRSVG